jgi:hypothetical protein
MTTLPERTRGRYARLAGAVFLVYIGAGLAETALFDAALGSGSAGARLAHLAAQAPRVHAGAALSLATIFSAIVLAVALFAVTRDCDLELAVLALCARVAEGVMGAIYVVPALGMLALARADAPPEASAALLATLAAVREGAMLLSAACFALGSAVFAYLFLRSRSIPGSLAWLGVASSLLLVVGLPLQLAFGVRSAAAWLMWLPMLVFEVVLALWLLIKGVKPAHVRAGG